MDISTILVTIFGLTFFEIITSIDNAIINADVLATMSVKARKWFLFWGILFAVFIIRGILPLLIVWVSIPQFGLKDALFATFSSDPDVVRAIHESAPSLLVGGGVFLVLLFLHWVLIEPKEFGLRFEPFLYRHGIWFYTLASFFLLAIVYITLKINTSMTLSAVVGSTAFFITHGFKNNAEQMEAALAEKRGISDISKILYLEVIDATFSIDGVLGAFAFTLSVPLILIGNGIGAFVVRQMTIGNLDRIKRLIYLKNGAMYSILFLGIIMISESLGADIPHYISPFVTFGVIGFFYIKSLRKNGESNNMA